MSDISNDALLQPLNSLTANSMTDLDNTPKPLNTGFKVRRILTVVVLALTDMVVFFQRAVPTVVSKPMAESYHLEVSDLAIFSSMFFYPYGFIQPFAGLLADVLDPRYLIGICSLIASLGAFLCGISKTFAVACIGRLLVGIGSAPIYVPSCRAIANWFPLEQYSRAVGVFCAFAGCGGLIAQGPFSKIIDVLDWRWCFYLVAILGLVMALVVLIFIRGNPVSFGYEAVNLETSVDTSTYSFKEKMIHLGRNFITVTKNYSFWLVGIYNFGINGAFFDINGMWGGPYLQDVYGYSAVKMGNVMMAISIGNVVGPVIIPFFAELFNTKKWFIFWSSVVANLCLLPFIFFVDSLPLGAIILLFFTYAVFSNSLTNVAFPMCREYFHASVSGTAVGCCNLTAYISTVILQNCTGKLLKDHFKKPDNTYTAEGYKYALWVLSLAFSVFGNIIIAFAKDTKGSGKLSCCCSCKRCIIIPNKEAMMYQILTSSS